MRITILGTGALADTLAKLSERASHTVRRKRDSAASGANDRPDLLLLAGGRSGVESTLANMDSLNANETIVVDATTAERREGSPPPNADREWIDSALPGARVVRAFASVPTNALASVLTRSSGQTANLAVPLAGNDRQAKAQVARFMRDIGVEPFDLGAMTNAGVLEPGGALWGKALNPTEMLETVGWLSGDG